MYKTCSSLKAPIDSEHKLCCDSICSLSGFFNDTREREHGDRHSDTAFHNISEQQKHMSEGVEEHDCISLTQELIKACPDTKASPLCQAVQLYIDGSCHRAEEGLNAGFAVVRRNGDQYVTVTSGPVQQPSAQRVELVALKEALKEAKNRDVNIFTDSAFIYHVVHRDLGA